MKEFHGCWPTMITPFTADNKVDYVAIKKLVDWFVKCGSTGIFSVCQSSEMFFLSEQEKLDIAKAVIDAAAGRVKVIASGHTSDDHQKQIDELGKMAELNNLDAVVLVSNRMAKQDEGPDVFNKNAEDIFRQLPNVKFGLYECPYPYLRLLTDDFLVDCAKTGKLVFLKDVSCAREIQKRRVQLVKDTDLSLFNANTSTLLDSLIDGYDGYNGVMANFHMDLYVWLYNNFKAQPEVARELMDFLTVAAIIEARCYPVSAKWHQNEFVVPMTTVTRSKDPALLNENGMHEMRSLHRMEEAWRKRLGL